MRLISPRPQQKTTRERMRQIMDTRRVSAAEEGDKDPIETNEEEEDSGDQGSVFNADVEVEETSGGIDKSLAALLLKYPVEPNGRQSEETKRAQGLVKTAKERPGSDRGLCVFYWILVCSITGLITFSIWLSVQIGLRHAMMLANRGRIISIFFPLFFLH